MTFEAYKERMRIFGQDHGFELGSEFEAIATMEQAEGYVQRWLFRVVSTSLYGEGGSEEVQEQAFQRMHGLFDASSELINLDNPIYYQEALTRGVFLSWFIIQLSEYVARGDISYVIDSNFIEYFLVVLQLSLEGLDDFHHMVSLMVSMQAEPSGRAMIERLSEPGCFERRLAIIAQARAAAASAAGVEAEYVLDETDFTQSDYFLILLRQFEAYIDDQTDYMQGYEPIDEVGISHFFDALLFFVGIKKFRLRLQESPAYQAMIAGLLHTLDDWKRVVPSVAFELSLELYKIMLLCDQDNRRPEQLSGQHIPVANLVKKLLSVSVLEEDKFAIFELFEHIQGSPLLRDRFMYVALEKPTEGTVQSVLIQVLMQLISNEPASLVGRHHQAQADLTQQAFRLLQILLAQDIQKTEPADVLRRKSRITQRHGRGGSAFGGGGGGGAAAPSLACRKKWKQGAGMGVVVSGPCRYLSVDFCAKVMQITRDLMAEDTSMAAANPRLKRYLSLMVSIVRAMPEEMVKGYRQKGAFSFLDAGSRSVAGSGTSDLEDAAGDVNRWLARKLGLPVPKSIPPIQRTNGAASAAAAALRAAPGSGALAAPAQQDAAAAELPGP